MNSAADLSNVIHHLRAPAGQPGRLRLARPLRRGTTRRRSQLWPGGTGHWYRGRAPARRRPPPGRGRVPGYLPRPGAVRGETRGPPGPVQLALHRRPPPGPEGARGRDRGQLDQRRFDQIRDAGTGRCAASSGDRATGCSPSRSVRMGRCTPDPWTRRFWRGIRRPRNPRRPRASKHSDGSRIRSFVGGRTAARRIRSSVGVRAVRCC